jgi:hypothetical protein
LLLGTNTDAKMIGKAERPMNACLQAAAPA